jgi:hypothetical protein
MPIDDNSDVPKDDPYAQRNLGRNTNEPRRRFADGILNENIFTYGTCTNETAFGVGRDLDAEISRGRRPSGVGRHPGLVPRGERGSASPSGRNDTKVQSRHDQGSHITGYQVVEDQVLDDPPVRTVNMWREEVARSAWEADPRPGIAPIQKVRQTCGYDADVDRDETVVGEDNHTYHRPGVFEHNMHALMISGRRGKEFVKEVGIICRTLHAEAID